MRVFKGYVVEMRQIFNLQSLTSVEDKIQVKNHDLFDPFLDTQGQKGLKSQHGNDHE